MDCGKPPVDADHREKQEQDMPISNTNSASFGFIGRIGGNAPVAGGDASLSAAEPENLQDAVGDGFGDEPRDAEVDFAQVDAALSQIMAMSIRQAASARVAQPSGSGTGGAMAVLAVLQTRNGAC
jgi:hypothetical protein